MSDVLNGHAIRVISTTWMFANESRPVGALPPFFSLTQGVASLALGFRISPQLGLARRK
jgi:hypothetical protein